VYYFLIQWHDFVNATINIEVMEKEVTFLNRSATISFSRTVLCTVISTITVHEVWDD